MNLIHANKTGLHIQGELYYEEWNVAYAEIVYNTLWQKICFALFTDVYRDLMHATFYNPYHDYSWIWYHIMSTEGEIIGIDMDI
jgi:hypothetical protein